MTDIDTAALREVAESLVALPDWAVNPAPCAEFDELATPHAVLALLDEVDRLRATLARVEAIAADLAHSAAFRGISTVITTALTPDTKETDMLICTFCEEPKETVHTGGGVNACDDCAGEADRD